MALLDLLTKKGSTFTNLDGKNPKTTYKDTQTSKLTSLLSKSTLDLDGKTPKSAYKNNAPENQGGRI